MFLSKYSIFFFLLLFLDSEWVLHIDSTSDLNLYKKQYLEAQISTLCLILSASMTTSHPVTHLKEDDLTQECRYLLPSLPKQPGWTVTHLYQYQGFWLTSIQLQGVLACQKHFAAQVTDILLVSTPKSGTTWLKSIIFSLVNRTRYSKRTPPPPITLHSLELVLYLQNPSPDFSFFTSPRLFSTHLPLTSLPDSVRDSACKVVYVCRNPKDTFVFLWQFTNKLRLQHMGTNSVEEVFDKFCEGVSLFGPFWDHVLGYWNESLRRPEKFLFLKYEEMKEQPCLHLKRLADFIGCPFSPGEERNGVIDDIIGLCSFDKLSNLEVNKEGRLLSGEENRVFFRRGEVGDWKNYLTPAMVNRLDKISEHKFTGSGLKL